MWHILLATHIYVAAYPLLACNTYKPLLPTHMYVLQYTLATPPLATHIKCVGIDPTNTYFSL
jgi:hypothetical protein